MKRKTIQELKELGRSNIAQYLKTTQVLQLGDVIKITRRVQKADGIYRDTIHVIYCAKNTFRISHANRYKRRLK